ncbi:fibrobacter succinogenes major paralogous domain-containing protein [Crocinitomicaceae bacterium]|nr:fibrobacter succinogenes major paralogous domain-containing protein [Crocinitomicaceae bacterium]
MKKISLSFLLLLAVITMSFAQTIKDIDGNEIKYKKIGDLYWTENIRTTTLWSNEKPLKQVDKAPTPGKDYSGALYIDANDKFRFAERYYSIEGSNYYYTWNTANNVTATKQMAQSKFEEVKDLNSSLCPCGWRIPSFGDVGNALISLKLFPNQESYNNWLYEEGIFNSKFLFAQNMASATKSDISQSILENKFFNKNEMAGVYGFMGMDDSKPLMKDIAMGVWLRNLGVSWGPDMQMDGAMLMITEPKKSPNTFQLIIKSEFSTELASVKCVTDEQGFQRFLAYEKEASVIREKKLKEQEQLRLAKEKEIAEKKKTEEEEKRKFEEYKNSELTTSESLMLGSWSLEGTKKDDQIEDFTINITFSKEKRKFNMTINIDSWTVAIANVYGANVKTKDKKQWTQKLSFDGTWGKVDNNTVKLIYENYENISGSLNDATVKKLVGIIDEKMDVINIESFKVKKMNVKFGEVVEMKGKRTAY